MFENPFNLNPASAEFFIGRKDILDSWRRRLTPNTEAWNSAKSLMIVGDGGMGKTSLLNQLNRIADKEFKATIISIDIGRMSEIDDIDDFFQTLTLEMPQPVKPGTKIRIWLGLQPSAPMKDMVGQIAGELLNQIVSFAINLVGRGIKLGNFRTTPKDIQGVTFRLAQFFINLSILTEEQKTPTIVFLDQFGKCLINRKWTYIAGMFLIMCKKFRTNGANEVIFVISSRPKEKGELEYHLDRQLFGNDIFHYIDLFPFSYEEAIESITVRGGVYLNNNLARKIIDLIIVRGPLDPYTIQLSCINIWEYIFEGTHSPAELELEAEKERLLQFILGGHDLILQPFFQEPIQWAILIQLAQSDGGLDILQLHQRIRIDHNISTQEMKTGVDQLLNPARGGYRLINVLEHGKNPNRFILAHDLLKEYLISLIPEHQIFVNKVKLIIEYGYWREQETGQSLSEWELQLIWEHNRKLFLTPDYFLLILKSEIPTGSPRLFYWYSDYPDEFIKGSLELHKTLNEEIPKLRVSLLLCALGFLQDQPHDLIKRILRPSILDPSTNSIVNTFAIEVALHLGESSIPLLNDLIKSGYHSADIIFSVNEKLQGAALPVLRTFALKGNFSAIDLISHYGDASLPILQEILRSGYAQIRGLAARSLTEMGVNVTPLLTEIALAGNEHIRADVASILRELGLPTSPELNQQARDNVTLLRQNVASASGTIGEPALPVLAELARDEESKVRQNVAIALGTIGEPALPVLAELARDEESKVRQNVAIALGTIGEPALPVLAELSKDKASAVRQNVATALGAIGEPALPVLTKLARDYESVVRLNVASSLATIGEPALPVLTVLARDKASDVRLNVANALGTIGEPALPALSELINLDNDISGSEFIVTLGQIGKAALPILDKLAQSSNLRLLAKVARALGEIGELGLSILSDFTKNEKFLFRSKKHNPPGEWEIDKYPSLMSARGGSMEFSESVLIGLQHIGMPALPIIGELASEFFNIDIVQSALRRGIEGMSVLIDMAQGKVSQQVLAFLGKIDNPPKEFLIDYANRGYSAAIISLGKFGNHTLFSIATIDPVGEYRSRLASLALIRNSLI